MDFGVASWSILEDLCPAAPHTLPLLLLSQVLESIMPFHGSGPSLSLLCLANSYRSLGHFSHVTSFVTFSHNLKAIMLSSVHPKIHFLLLL